MAIGCQQLPVAELRVAIAPIMDAHAPRPRLCISTADEARNPRPHNPQTTPKPPATNQTLPKHSTPSTTHKHLATKKQQTHLVAFQTNREYVRCNPVSRSFQPQPATDPTMPYAESSFRRFVFLACTLLAGALGCNESPPTSAGVFSEHHQTLRGDGDREVGADCAKEGGPACRSGLCLHYQADPDKGWTCTRTCAHSAECPAGWECRTTQPTANAQWCIPPASWKPTAP